jgi:hypothetical protein
VLRADTDQKRLTWCRLLSCLTASQHRREFTRQLWPELWGELLQGNHPEVMDEYAMYHACTAFCHKPCLHNSCLHLYALINSRTTPRLRQQHHRHLKLSAATMLACGTGTTINDPWLCCQLSRSTQQHHQLLQVPAFEGQVPR